LGKKGVKPDRDQYDPLESSGAVSSARTYASEEGKEGSDERGKAGSGGKDGRTSLEPLADGQENS